MCTYDCPYCQVGATTDKTLTRHENVPVSEVLAEFDRWMTSDGQADCVTLAGGGEPTLHSRFGEVIEAIGARGRFRRILLSNGSLFSLPEVRAAAIKAEVVKATLSSWDQVSFEKIHHPHPSLRYDVFLQGLKSFRAEFRGDYWLEVFVVPGVNDTPEQMTRIADLARQIGPDHIHLNTAVRPAQDQTILPVSAERLAAFALLFNPIAEVVGAGAAPVPSARGGGDAETLAARIRGAVQRHPSTANDISVSINVAQPEVEKALAGLVERGLMRVERRGLAEFFVAS